MKFTFQYYVRTSPAGSPAHQRLQLEGPMGAGAFDLGEDASEWTYLQLGQEGDDLQSMTKRWQFEQAKATILLIVDESSFCPLLQPVDMLSSRSSFCSSGLVQLFLAVFLFT